MKPGMHMAQAFVVTPSGAATGGKEAFLEMETTAAYRHLVNWQQGYQFQWVRTSVKLHYLSVCLIIVKPIVILHDAIAS